MYLLSTKEDYKRNKSGVQDSDLNFLRKVGKEHARKTGSIMQIRQKKGNRYYLIETIEA